MKFDIKQWESKKREIEKQKAQRDKDITRFEMLNEQLEKEFGCTYETADEKKKELETKKTKIEQQLDLIAEELESYA
jgi:hypothetical protein